MRTTRLTPPSVFVLAVVSTFALAPLGAVHAQENTPGGTAAVGTESAADHIAIVELANLFENAFDEGDINTHMATWADEMSFESPFGNYDDRDGYREWVSGFYEQMSGMGGTRHLITNNVVDVDGDRASQTCYLVILGRTMNDGGPALMATVRFEDELVRTAEGWRFTSRVLHLDQDPSSLGG